MRRFVKRLLIAVALLGVVTFGSLPAHSARTQEAICIGGSDFGPICIPIP
jgi:hypothetical protein